MTWHPDLAARLHLLDGMTSWMDLDEEQRARQAAWDAPHGEPESTQCRSTIGGSQPTRRDRRPDLRPGRRGRIVRLVWLHGGASLRRPGYARGRRSLQGVVALRAGCPSTTGWRSTGALRCRTTAWWRPTGTRDHASELRIDAKIAIGGGSAGANLAAGCCTCDDGAPCSRYPVLHPILPKPSEELTAALAQAPKVLLMGAEHREDDEIGWINENYLGGPLAMATPYAYPGLAESLVGYPRTLIENDEFDGLRSSGEAFAEALARDGVEVEQLCVRGVPHGHLNRVGFGPAKETVARFAARLNR